MYYNESKKISEQIEKAKRILVNLHVSPDGDSVGSALGMASYLKRNDKQVFVITEDDLPHQYDFLPNSDLVKKTNFSSFDFSKYDLLIVLDTSDWRRLTKKSKVEIPKMPIINIDHHFTNSKFGSINIIDADRGSTAEIVYLMFKDMEVSLDKGIATCLLTGLIYDTSSLQNPSAGIETAEIYKNLMLLGANKNEIIFYLYKSLDLPRIKALAEILRNLEIDSKYKFVWSAVPYEIYKKYGNISGVKTIAANLFSSSIEGTDFGIIMVEEGKKLLNVSFRGRTDFVDTSIIAKQLGGGGHKKASAANIEGLEFKDAVEKVLETAREIVNAKN